RIGGLRRLLLQLLVVRVLRPLALQPLRQHLIQLLLASDSLEAAISLSAFTLRVGVRHVVWCRIVRHKSPLKITAQCAYNRGCVPRPIKTRHPPGEAVVERRESNPVKAPNWLAPPSATFRSSVA